MCFSSCSSLVFVTSVYKAKEDVWTRLHVKPETSHWAQCSGTENRQSRHLGAAKLISFYLSFHDQTFVLKKQTNKQETITKYTQRQFGANKKQIPSANAVSKRRTENQIDFLWIYHIHFRNIGRTEIVVCLNIFEIKTRFVMGVEYLQCTHEWGLVGRFVFVSKNCTHPVSFSPVKDKQ